MGLQSENKQMADSTHFGGCVCPSSSLPSQRGDGSTVYLCKRTMQNKARLELADYEAPGCVNTTEVDIKKSSRMKNPHKTRKSVYGLQNDIRSHSPTHTPAPEAKQPTAEELQDKPGCVNTTEVDIKKSSRMKNPHKTRKSVYGLQNDIRSHSPTHTPAPEAKQPTEEELQDKWMCRVKIRLLGYTEQYIEYDPFLTPPDPSNPWISDDTTIWELEASLLGYTEQYIEYDPFLTPPDPSNPWISDDTTIWELEASKEPGQQRVKRWAFGINEVLKDQVGREQFLKFLESEFSSENLRFWLAVQELKKRPIREVPTRVQEIWLEFLAPGAPSAINVDSKSYGKTTQNVKDPGRYTFEDAQEHIYKLMKSDSYARFIRSSAYQELLQAKKKIKFWQVQLDRHRLKMSKVAESLLGYTEQYIEYDPFLTPPDPSNPWISDDTTIWELEASKEPGQQRVKRWAFGINEVLKDQVGREQFLKFLESEFSSENLRFWLAVQELKKRPIREVPTRVQEIWLEFLAPGAPSAINVDSKSYGKTTQNVKDPGRYTFEDAQEHIYKLMKSDSYARFIRSSAYQELLQAKKKGRNIPIFPCHKNCTPTLRASTNLL
ncbi:UNVERIFIED_CONTAM: hypothetical protein FKN15_048183 [Acipenser sinensis]